MGTTTLVAVYVGPDRKSAELKGNLHFATPPAKGDKVEVEGQSLTVAGVWHTPGNRTLGAKYAIRIWAEGSVPPSGLSAT
mgnify:CR=1 FL=1